MFETRTDDNAKFPKQKDNTDQFYGDPESTHLYALHVLRRSVRQMVSNTWYYSCWDSRLELCPKRLKAGVSHGSVHDAPLEGARTDVNRSIDGVETSLSESLSGSRDVTGGHKAEGVRPSPINDTLGSTTSDKSIRASEVAEEGLDLSKFEKKPWVRCGITRWEKFLFGPYACSITCGGRGEAQ